MKDNRTSMLCEEIQTLRQNFKTCFSKSNVILYDRIYRQSFSDRRRKGNICQHEAFSRFLQQKDLLLHGDDIFAGQLQHYLMRYSQPLPGDGDPETFDPSVIRTGAVNPPENAKATVDMCLDFVYTPEEKKTLSYLEPGVAAGYFTHYPVGHAITGFPFVLHTGFRKIKEMLTSRIAKERDPERRETGRIMLATVESCRAYFGRYRVKADLLAKEAKTQAERKRMERISNAVAWIMDEPADSFFEALQFIILLQELILTQVKGSMSLGRLDVLLSPYLQRDYRRALESPESAQVLLDACMIKLAGCIGGYQNLTLGGCDADGNYAGNEISLMFLRSARRLGYDQPLISFRLNENVPDCHWEEILCTLEKGGGFPALFWDDTIIASRLRLGAPAADARDYGIIGCVEPGICGKEFSNTEALRINWCKTLELMLNDGVCPVTGRHLFLKNRRKLDSIKSFGEFLAWYAEELDFAIEKAANICCLTDRHFYERFPSTLLSVTLMDCIDRLSDCADTGCVYCNSAINHTGVANAADSLTAIKKVVFDEKRLSLAQFRDVLNHDYEGSTALLHYIQKSVPKYGNDLKEADSLTAFLVNRAAAKTQSLKNERGGVFMAGFYSVYHHAAMGKLTGALPDEKRKGEALSNGLSPAQGADRESPAAVVNSMAGFDQAMFANGMVLDLKVNPSFFQNAAHRKYFRAFAEVYFRQGGMELQVNVVDKKTLLDAKKHPENYQNLLVRVSGFSAYFVSLFEELQDEIIKRTEYGGEKA